MFQQEDEIISHVKEQHPEKADLIPRLESGATKKVNYFLTHICIDKELLFHLSKSENYNFFKHKFLWENRKQTV